MLDIQTILLAGGFFVVVVAARHLSSYFARFHLPLITGLLFIGIFAGPFVFDLVRTDSWNRLDFVNDISLAFIAFAASAELYLKELRNRFKSIKWVTIGQLVITFILSGLGVYYLIEFIPFASEFSFESKIAISILMGSIFVARSPASAMALINEMRAKGPFTQTVIGVTILIDFLVIILFSICLSFSEALINGNSFDFTFFFKLILEISASFGVGLLLGKLLQFILKLRLILFHKGLLILASGFGIYRLEYLVEHYSEAWFGLSFAMEPLLICIVGSFWITNFTRYRLEFTKILNDLGPYIYVPFFTLAGLSLQIDILYEYAVIALILVTVRLFSIMLGSYFGGIVAGDPPLYRRMGWMPFITQAGVGIGLTTIVASSFPEWGQSFSTLVISVIVINQIVGPPLFKWAIKIVKEGHRKASTPSFDGVNDAIIFGLEGQSVALAKQLQENGWLVKVVTLKEDVDLTSYPGIDIYKVDEVNLQTLEELDIRLCEAAVCLLTDDENLRIVEILYENFGTRDVIIRLNHRYNFDKFHDLGALIVDPSTAIVSLLDHLVRSPQAASLLLGMEGDQDSIDIEVQNRNLHGLLLRDLRLPADTIVLAVNRGGHIIISHGYTKLRIGDSITLVGSKEGLEEVSRKFAQQ